MISTILIPALEHFLNSLPLIRLDALVMSGCCSPLPAQKSFMPPPEPVDSTIGVLYFDFLPNSSATAVEKGNTVDDPTILICSSAFTEMPGIKRIERATINDLNVFLIFFSKLLFIKTYQS